MSSEPLHLSPIWSQGPGPHEPRRLADLAEAHKCGAGRELRGLPGGSVSGPALPMSAAVPMTSGSF